MKLAYLTLALVAFSGAATAAPTAAPDASVGKTDAVVRAPSPAVGKVKCTRERVTGSNRSVKLCLTEEQARTLSAEDKVDVSRSQHNGLAQDD